MADTRKTTRRSAPKKKAPTSRVQRMNYGRGHGYKIDGEKAEGVTTIINNGVPKPALIGWAARTISEFVVDRLQERNGSVLADDLIPALLDINSRKPPRYREKWDGGFSRLAMSKLLSGVHWEDRDRAANRGTEVHKFAEKLASGEDVDVPEEIVGHVDSYIQFLEDYQPEVLLLETVVANFEYRYAGTLDAVFNIPALGGAVLLDPKTNRSGPFGEVGLQLAGYAQADVYLDADGNEHPCWEINGKSWELRGAYALWLTPDSYELIPYDLDAEDEYGCTAFDYFLYAQQVAHFQTERSQTIKGEALPRPRKAGAA